MADDDAGEIGVIRDKLLAQLRQCAPIGKVDRGAGDVAVADGQHVGDQRGFRPARDDLLGMHHVAGRTVVLQIERPDAQRGDRAARCR